ncbi:MAG: CBS domain-containing protein [Planctomycetes bacterium]|nr:CBS domain-containing protein [Planctomycetota bacterium]
MIRFQDLTACDVMTPNPLCLDSDATLTEAEELLLSAGVDEAPIVGDSGEYLGSCSVRDLLLARRERNGARTVGGLPKRATPTCSGSLRLAQACQLMIRERSRRIVVVAGGRPVGIVSCTEAARVLACLEDLSHARKPWNFTPFEEGTHPEESALGAGGI